MSQRIVTTLIDDIDGTEATTTVRFNVNEYTYEIDLNESHYDEFMDAVAPYQDVARTLKSPAAKRKN